MLLFYNMIRRIDKQDRVFRALGHATRRRILEGALLLFAREGFHASSMRELARVVELQPSAVYVHFPSKEHLLAELVRAGHEVHQQALRAALLEAGADPLDQLRALAAAHVRSHASYPHLAVVVNTELEALSPELAAPGRMSFTRAVPAVVPSLFHSS